MIYYLKDTKESACLRLFLDYHGLDLLWSWAVDIPPNAIDLRIDVSLLNTFMFEINVVQGKENR